MKKFRTRNAVICTTIRNANKDPRPPFARRLKLRTVVSIAPEGPMEDEAMFCREHAAQLVPIRAELYREEAVTVSSQQVAQVN